MTPRRHWNARRLEAEVWKRVTEFFDSFESVREALIYLAGKVTKSGGQEILELELRQIDDQLAASRDRMSKLSVAWTRGRISSDDYEEEVAQIEKEQSIGKRKRDRVIQRLGTTIRVNEAELDRIGILVAAGVNDGSPSDLGTLGYAPDWVTLALDGPPWTYFDPETPHGHRIWDLRRQVLEALKVQTVVKEWDIDVSAGVPVEVSNLSQSSRRPLTQRTGCD